MRSEQRTGKQADSQSQDASYAEEMRRQAFFRELLARRAREEAQRRAQKEAEELFDMFIDGMFGQGPYRQNHQNHGNRYQSYGYGFNNQPPVTENYHETLGVPKTATNEEIKAAFRKKAKSCHPDLFKGDKAKEAEFKRLNEAYHALSGKGTH